MTPGISLLKVPAKNWKGDALLLLASEGQCEKIAPAPYTRYVKTLEARKDFEGKKGSLVKLPLFDDNVKNLYLAGLGKAEEYTPDRLRDALTAALRKIGRERNKSVLAISAQKGPDVSVILGEAAELAGYVFDKYKKKDDESDENFSLREIFTQDLEIGRAHV